MPTNPLWIEHTERAAWDSVKLLRTRLAEAEERIRALSTELGRAEARVVELERDLERERTRD